MRSRIIKAVSRASSLLVLLLLCSCGNTLYHNFCNVDDGWGGGDTLTFEISNPVVGGEACNVYVELRTAPDYPYRKLWLHTSLCRSNDKKMKSDTLCCEIFDSLGVHKGSSAGLFYQAQYELGQIVLAAADTLTVSIAHIMDGDVNGVRSVGVRVERCGQHLSSGN